MQLFLAFTEKIGNYVIQTSSIKGHLVTLQKSVFEEGKCFTITRCDLKKKNILALRLTVDYLHQSSLGRQLTLTAARQEVASRTDVSNKIIKLDQSCNDAESLRRVSTNNFFKIKQFYTSRYF